MEIFQQLAKVVRQQNAQGELPDFITPLLLRIAENSAEVADRAERVAILPFCSIHHTGNRVKVRY